MKWVVCDIGPLHYLILVGCEDILPRLFDRVVVPPSVLAALRHPRNDPAVCAWAQNPPTWLFIHAPEVRQSFASLDPGAADVLSLTADSDVACLLMDDPVARVTAQQQGAIVVGTLCILWRAARLGWLNFDEALTKLRATSFRGSNELLAAVSMLSPRRL
jgi:predicted nucleic acid-binding protein